jgi:hypothetical protein
MLDTRMPAFAGTAVFKTAHIFDEAALESVGEAPARPAFFFDAGLVGAADVTAVKQVSAAVINLAARPRAASVGRCAALVVWLTSRVPFTGIAALYGRAATNVDHPTVVEVAKILVEIATGAAVAAAEPPRHFFAQVRTDDRVATSVRGRAAKI